MDIQKEREVFKKYMREIGAAGFMFELDEDGNFDDTSMAYAWSAWQAAKAQAVPEGFVVVQRDLIKTLHEELLDHEPDSFVVIRDICELWRKVEAQEQE